MGCRSGNPQAIGPRLEAEQLVEFAQTGAKLLLEALERGWVGRIARVLLPRNCFQSSRGGVRDASGACIEAALHRGRRSRKTDREARFAVAMTDVLSRDLLDAGEGVANARQPGDGLGIGGGHFGRLRLGNEMDHARL